MVLQIINKIVDLGLAGVALIFTGISCYAFYDGWRVESSADIAEDIVQLAETEEGDLFERLRQESEYVVG